MNELPMLHLIVWPLFVWSSDSGEELTMRARQGWKSIQSNPRLSQLRPKSHPAIPTTKRNMCIIYYKKSYLRLVK